MDLRLIFLGALFLGFLLLLEGLYRLAAERWRERDGVTRRMRGLTQAAGSSDAAQRLRRDALHGLDGRHAAAMAIDALQRIVARAGYVLGLRQIATIMAAAAAAAFVVLMIAALRYPWLTGSPAAVALLLAVSLAFGVAGPVAYFRRAQKKRLKAFSEQLPDTLDIMTRSLRAGHPVAVAMSLAAKKMPDPMGAELRVAVDEMAYGLDMREALQKVGDRVGLEDFQYVVVAIAIQHETGGNLAEVLENLSGIVRARFRMFKKVYSLSAEGRFSAKLLGSLPFAFAAVMYLSQPEYYLNVAHEPTFWKIAGVAAGLQFIGILIMRRLINFRV
jgi:tight adherence protein B